MVFRFAVLAAGLSLAAPASAPAHAKDTDSDGITDQHEQLLGTDPQFRDSLQVVIDDGVDSPDRRSRPHYDGSKDVTRIEFSHVGGDRYLWRATLSEAPRLDDTVFHLYIDADARSDTGRQGNPEAASTGTEYMLSVVGGRSTSGHYDADGNRSNGPLVTHLVDGKTLLITADIDLARDERGLRFDLYVLCHTTSQAGDSPWMSDSTSKQRIESIPLLDRAKRMRPRDHQENFQVQATYGYRLLCNTLADSGTHVVPHDELELESFEVDLATTRRWPHVRWSGAEGFVATRIPEAGQARRLRHEAPAAGRYHVGFMMYDDAHDERIGFYVNEKLCGVAVANQNNNQTWLYWLTEARTFSGGERVELRPMGASGKHGICNLLFLRAAPEVRIIPREVRHLTHVVPADEPRSVIVSWTTSWPCATRFEYGEDTAYGKTLAVERNCLVHRVVLKDLDPTTVYHGRAMGTARDGSTYASGDMTFQARIPPPPPTRAPVARVPLEVRNPYPFSVENWPITTGIPFPQGELGSVQQVRLTRDAEEVTSQRTLLARWPDGSVKWLLLTFNANVKRTQGSEYCVEYGSRVKAADPPRALRMENAADGLQVDAGAIQFRIDRQGNIADLCCEGRQLLASGEVACTVAVDATGTGLSSTTSGAAEVEIEEAGPLRAAIKVTSQLAVPKGPTSLRIEKRIFAYLDRPMLQISHTLVVAGSEKFASLEKLAYQLPISNSDSSWEVPTVAGSALRLDSTASSVTQLLDSRYVRDGDEYEDRLAGTILAQGEVECAVSVRDFWQNYPKGFSISPQGLDVELCPDFEAGLYDAFPFEKEGHQLYYYLLDGHYRLKRGLSKTHEMLLCFGARDQQHDLCKLFQRPLLATAPGEWYCDSKAFYDVAPRDTEWFRLYEKAIDRNLETYEQRRERQRDFGMLNFGDWYGERGTNWGNVEYDTQHAFFLEYIRSGNPRAFFLGAATELHNRDIDTVQWTGDGLETGAVYVHQMCHVGEYYDRPVPGSLGYPRGGYTVSHAWTEGHFDHFFLTGDRRSRDTGRAVADFFIRKQLGRPYDFSTCRTPGWQLIMLAANYAATNDPYYLNAARVIVERVLETQDLSPRMLPVYQQEGRQSHQVGGWPRMMVPGHCHCEPRHRGNAGFMVAVLLSGLKYYHDVTQDPRVKEAIIQGAHYLLEETYSDEIGGFRYTSCPETEYRPGSTPLMAEGIARAHLWTRDERFRRMLLEALPRGAGGSGYGKGFSMYYRMAPRVLADLKAAGIRLDTDPPSK